MMDQGSVIVGRLGRVMAQRLARTAGGTRVFVPADPERAEGLKRRFGADLAIALVFHFGGQRIYVPVGARLGPVSIADVERLASRNLSHAKIARALGCSERVVAKKLALIRSRSVAQPEQETTA